MVKETSPVKPYQCDHCENKYRRVDHLRRHIKQHTGQSKYQCPCGDKFSRNDVLARHLRRCEKGQGHQQTVQVHPQKQSRAKSACDRCAKLKLRCDSQHPCRPCSSSSSYCSYTRQGYSDPYEHFKTGAMENRCEPLSTVPFSPQGENSVAESDEATLVLPNLEDICNSTTPSHDVLEDNSKFVPMQGLHTETPSSAPSAGDFDISTLSASGNENRDYDLSFLYDFQFDAEGFFTFPEIMAYSDLGYGMAPQPMPGIGISQGGRCALDSRLTAPQLPYAPHVANGFSPQQIDPVEAKCLEIRELSLNGEPLMPKHVIDKYITRETLVFCSELYGKHFQPNVPILHRPTFNLTQTSPILLLAIMLLGACYSENLIPVAERTRFAMRLLVFIEQQPHETEMETPPLSTIQACVILRPLLMLSLNEKANRVASLYFSRIISMAERCGLFDPTDPVDYSKLTASTFDWHSWIERETRKRVACQIFTQDMALCVFRRRSSYFSPLAFKVDLPCYESCWEADTASKCLDQLQNLPNTLRLSTAMQTLQSESLQDAELFDASAFGMTLLILGMHTFLFHATQVGPEPCEKTTQRPELESSDPVSRLQQAFANNSIVALADDLVAAQDSATFKNINRALEKWRTNWDLRGCRAFKQEKRTLSTDPVKYWWLAKLYLVLHLNRHALHKASEFSMPETESKNEQEKLQEIQLKVLGWLSRFRRGKEDMALSSECYLAEVVEPIDGTHE